MKAEEAMKDVKRLVGKTDEDTHVFVIIVTVDENNLGAANVCVKGDVNIIAQTLGQTIERHTKLREAMMLDALTSMMESNQENKTLN
jgi:hypothetical protein